MNTLNEPNSIPGVSPLPAPPPNLRTEMESARAEIQAITGEDFVTVESKIDFNGDWEYGAYVDGWGVSRGDTGNTLEECVNSFRRDPVEAAREGVESAQAMLELAQRRYQQRCHDAAVKKEAKSES